MKRMFFAVSFAVACFFISCNNDNDATTGNKYTEEEQKNIAAADAIARAFSTGNASIIDSVVAEDFIDHTNRGDLKGRDSLKAMVQYVHQNFKDMKAEKVRDAANGDFVYSWMRYTGTSDGSMGMPKGPYEMNSVEVGRYKDGKVVEHWNFMDIRDVMEMMPQPTTQTDTSQVKK